MSQFTTLTQLLDFYNNKVLEEEPDPKKAQTDQLNIQNAIKKYTKKGMIHGGKDAIAPTEDQWKIIKTYYKDKIQRYKTKSAKTILEKMYNRIRIRNYEEEKTLATRMYQWAKDFKVIQESKALSSILVLKPTEKGVMFTGDLTDAFPKGYTVQAYPVAEGKNKGKNKETNKDQHHYNTRSASKTAEEADDEEEVKKVPKRREQRPRDDEGDIPLAETALGYAVTDQSEDEESEPSGAEESSNTQSTPPPYQGAYPKIPPPFLTPDMIWKPPVTHQQSPPQFQLSPHSQYSKRATKATHEIKGEVSLTPLVPTTPMKDKDMEKKLECVVDQIKTLTSIVKGGEHLRLYDARQKKRQDEDELKEIQWKGQKEIMVQKEREERTQQDLTKWIQESQRNQKAPTSIGQGSLTPIKEEIEVYGTFSGEVDENRFNNVQIDGTVIQEQRRNSQSHTPPKGEEQEALTHAYPVRMSGSQTMYVPFTVKDWGEVMMALPSLAKGGVPWLRALLKKTAGDKLGWGDIQAALIKSADETVEGNIRKAIERRQGIQHIPKRMEVSVFRDDLEEELRKRFPCIVTEEFMSLQMKEDEDYYSYKQRATTIYHDVTGEPINAGTGITIVFRNTLVKGMPKIIQNALEDVMGLYTKSEDEFDAHCNHHVTKWLRSKRSQKEEKQEIELAAAKLQLQKYQSELKEKKKEKSTKVMNVQQEASESETKFVDPIANLTAAINTLQTQLKHEPTATSNVPQQQLQQQPPMITQYFGQQGNKGSGKNFKENRGGFSNSNNRNDNNRCYNCQGVGHWSKQCPSPNPVQKPQQGRPQQYVQRYNQQQYVPQQQQYMPQQPPQQLQQQAMPMPASSGRVMNLGNYQEGRDIHGCLNEY